MQALSYYVLLLRFAAGPKHRGVARSAEHHPQKAVEHQKNEDACERCASADDYDSESEISDDTLQLTRNIFHFSGQ